MRKNAMRFAIGLCATVALIGLGAIMFRLASAGPGAGLKHGETYGLWIEEAEISPEHSNRTWDPDGSAPDLFAQVRWRNNIVLETPEAPNALVARWDRTSINIAELLKSNLSAAALHNIATIKVSPDDLITVTIQDKDILSHDQVGSISVPSMALSTGRNRVIPSPSSHCPIGSITIRVASMADLDSNRPPNRLSLIEDGVVCGSPGLVPGQSGTISDPSPSSGYLPKKGKKMP